jgi:hypothetical protein
MIKKASMGLVWWALNFVAGCGSTVVDDKPFCANEPGSTICAPASFPFVTSAGALTDCQTMTGCTASKTTATLSQPQAGTVCLKGTVEAPSGYAWLLLAVSSTNESVTQIVDVFDAKTLGITGLQFTIENPPAAGVTLFATTAHQRSCTSPPDCLTGWNLTTGSRADVLKAFQTAGPESAPFSSFLNDDPNKVFDTSALAHFVFVVGPGDYDFCVSQLAFTNAAGATVSP